jgi:hypothetical protein
MKILYLTMMVLIFTTSSTAQETSPTPGPTHELSDLLKAESPEYWGQYRTAELASKEFHKEVDEILDPSGEIKEGTEEGKPRRLEFISILLAEHYQLRDLTFEDVIRKYGKPTTIHKVKKENLKLFKSIIGGMLINPPTANTLECYVYDNFYIWLVGEAFVLALSPRSARFDMYVRNQIKLESQ